MKFTKTNINTIPIEEAHGGSGSRQMLIQQESLTTPFLEAVTKGFLKSGSLFDWHNHIDIDEIFIVTQGRGKFFYREKGGEFVFEYKTDDIIIAPANMEHKIHAEGQKDSQGYFFRIKTTAHVKQNHTFIQLSIGDIPFEAVHNIPMSRQTLVTSDVVSTDYLEALTKGTLHAGFSWDWHDHKDVDEVSIVLHGEGKFFIENEETNYEEGDIFIIPAETLHKIESTKNTEFYFIRVRNK